MNKDDMLKAINLAQECIDSGDSELAANFEKLFKKSPHDFIQAISSGETAMRKIDWIIWEAERTLDADPNLGLSLKLHSIAKRLTEKGIKVPGGGATAYARLQEWRDGNADRVIKYEEAVALQKTASVKKKIWDAADSLEACGKRFTIADVSAKVGLTIERVAQHLATWKHENASLFLHMTGYDYFTRNPESTDLNLKISSNLLQRSVKMAEHHGISLNDLFENALRKYLDSPDVANVLGAMEKSATSDSDFTPRL